MTTQGLAHADIGRLGIWSLELRGADPSAAGDAAAELDEAGWGALWLAGAGGPGIWRSASHLLAATTRLSVALGVASIWGPDADIAAVEFSRITGQHGRRLLAGFGVSTPQNASAVGKPFGTPLDAMNNYLDDLDHATSPLSANDRILGALGPRMVELAGRRTSGIHPFLVTPESNITNRGILGHGALIAPHLAVVLETNPAKARQIARAGIGMFIGFPSYQANLRRLGFDDNDLVPGGSDRLIDRVVAWGSLDDVRRRVDEHVAAGADHLALHVLTGQQRMPRAEWAELSRLLSP
jgi:probable F420-dependent oxidoreductase